MISGAAGELTVNPDEDAAKQAVREWEQLAEKIANWEGPAQTKDGHRVQLLANVQDGPQAASAASTAVEGVGLFRTELLFLSSMKEPSVNDQAAAYGRVLNAFPKGKVVVRTLDAGSDKPVPFVEAEEEDNPALGVRGVRIAWDRQDILERQLDAIAKAVEDNDRGDGADGCNCRRSSVVCGYVPRAWLDAWDHGRSSCGCAVCSGDYAGN